MAAGAQLVGAGSANAAASPCPSTYTCIYQDQNFGRGVRGFSNPSANADLYWYLDTQPINFNDQMTSWINHRGRYSEWFVNRNLMGGAHCMPPNVEVKKVTLQENDTATVVATYGNLTAC